MRIGAPMTVAAGFSDAEFEGKRVELENVLKGMDEGNEKAPQVSGCLTSLLALRACRGISACLHCGT